MSENDPTEDALATIASILEHPEPPLHQPEKAVVEEKTVVDEKPLISEPTDADGYTRHGPGPMAAIRFKWTVQRGENGQYYVHETIGEHSAPIVSGPMTGEEAIELVDRRESEAIQRFEALRDEMRRSSGES